MLATVEEARPLVFRYFYCFERLCFTGKNRPRTDKICLPPQIITITFVGIIHKSIIRPPPFMRSYYYYYSKILDTAPLSVKFPPHS